MPKKSSTRFPTSTDSIWRPTALPNPRCGRCQQRTPHPTHCLPVSFRGNCTRKFKLYTPTFCLEAFPMSKYSLFLLPTLKLSKTDISKAKKKKALKHSTYRKYFPNFRSCCSNLDCRQFKRVQRDHGVLWSPTLVSTMF